MPAAIAEANDCACRKVDRSEMASHNIVDNARDSSAEEERSQDLPVAFLSAGHRFAPLRGRWARIDTFFVAQMELSATTARCAWVIVRSEANRYK